MLAPLLLIVLAGAELNGRIAAARYNVRGIDRELSEIDSELDALEGTFNGANRALGPGEDVINLSPLLSNGSVTTLGGDPGRPRAVFFVGAIQPTVDPTPGSKITGSEAMVIRNAVLIASHVQQATIGGAPTAVPSPLVPITIEDSVVDRRIHLGENVRVQNVTFVHLP